MTNNLAIDSNEIAFRTEMPISIDFDLGTAIAENAFRDDCNSINAIDFA